MSRADNKQSMSCQWPLSVCLGMSWVGHEKLTATKHLAGDLSRMGFHLNLRRLLNITRGSEGSVSFAGRSRAGAYGDSAANKRAVCPVRADMEEVHVVMVLPSWEALGRMKADEVDLAPDDDDAEGVCTQCHERIDAGCGPGCKLHPLPESSTPQGRLCSPLCWLYKTVAYLHLCDCGCHAMCIVQHAHNQAVVHRSVMGGLVCAGGWNARRVPAQGEHQAARQEPVWQHRPRQRCAPLHISCCTVLAVLIAHVLSLSLPGCHGQHSNISCNPLLFWACLGMDATCNGLAWQPHCAQPTVHILNRLCCRVLRRLRQPRQRGQVGAAAHHGQRRNAGGQRQRPPRQQQRPPRQRQQHQVHPKSVPTLHQCVSIMQSPLVCICCSMRVRQLGNLSCAGDAAAGRGVQRMLCLAPHICVLQHSNGDVLHGALQDAAG
jgi:hypothetical protein